MDYFLQNNHGDLSIAGYDFLVRLMSFIHQVLKLFCGKFLNVVTKAKIVIGEADHLLFRNHFLINHGTKLVHKDL